MPVMKAEMRVANCLHPLLSRPSSSPGGWEGSPLGVWLCCRVEYRVEQVGENGRRRCGEGRGGIRE